MEITSPLIYKDQTWVFVLIRGYTMVERNNKRKIIKIILIVFFFWMVSPVIIPDNYSGYTGEERRVVEATFSDDDPEIGPIQRLSVKEVTKYDSKWQVKIIHHTLFNIPAIESNLTVIQSGNGLSVTDFDFEKLTPFATLLALIQILIFYIFLYGVPISTIYFLIKFIKKRDHNKKSRT